MNGLSSQSGLKNFLVELLQRKTIASFVTVVIARYIGLLLSFSYILFSTVTSTFAVSGATSPMLAMWIPNIIYTVIAIVLYKKAPK